MSPSATPATQSEGRCRQLPCLLRKVERGHREPSAPPEPAQCCISACQAKCRSMSPSVTLATQSDGRCRHVPRCPRKVERRHREPTLQSAARCHQVPRLPSKVKVDVAKCHACHAKSSGVTGNQARRRSMSPSATLATQSAGRSRQVPRLPREVERRHREPSAPPEPAQCRKCHACHAKCRPMSSTATPATQSEGRVVCGQVVWSKLCVCVCECVSNLCVCVFVCVCVCKLCVVKLYVSN